MLPERLLRPLTVHHRAEVIDPADGSATVTWTTETITGRIGRGHATETSDGGRQAGVTTHTLYTNHQLEATDRITDPVTGTVWELAGAPVTVWGQTGIDHYEAPLRHADG